MRKYQNISQFLASPFNNNGDANELRRFEEAFNRISSEGNIKLVHSCKVVDSYFIHVKIASESTGNGSMYDVVVKFFTDNPNYIKDSHLRNYYLQFFSNSPSFIYKYAYAYNQKGYLIEALYNKLDSDYINTPPSNTNKDMKLLYDKSIYCVCRYLSDRKASFLNKEGPNLTHLVSVDTLFSGISTFKSIRFEQDLIRAEKRVLKEIAKETEELNRGRTMKITTSKISKSGLIEKAKKIVGGHKVKKIHGHR